MFIAISAIPFSPLELLGVNLIKCLIYRCEKLGSRSLQDTWEATHRSLPSGGLPRYPPPCTAQREKGALVGGKGLGNGGNIITLVDENLSQRRLARPTGAATCGQEHQRSRVTTDARLAETYLLPVVHDDSMPPSTLWPVSLTQQCVGVSGRT